MIISKGKVIKKGPYSGELNYNQHIGISSSCLENLNVRLFLQRCNDKAKINQLIAEFRARSTEFSNDFLAFYDSKSKRLFFLHVEYFNFDDSGLKEVKIKGGELFLVANVIASSNIGGCYQSLEGCDIYEFKTK